MGSFAPSRPGGAERAAPWPSGSASGCSSRSPTASAGASTAPWRSPPAAARSSAAAPARTGRAIAPPGRSSPATGSASPWTASRSAPATPTRSRRASAPSRRARRRPAGRRCTGPRCRSSGGRGGWPPSCWRPTPRTWCSTAQAAACTWAELAGAAAERGNGLAFEVRPGVDGAPGPSWPSGAVLAAVEVDTETGEVRIERLVSCDDAGHLLNPLLVRGQVHGALALGVAHALFEEFSYDEDGNPKTANFGDYAVITADVLPRYRLREIESPASGNELGVKGVGEAGTVGTPAAILNAVIDALAHLGVRHLELPATPERVLRAILNASGEEPSR